VERELFTRLTVNCRFKFQKRSQLFIGSHNETLSGAMCVRNPDKLSNISVTFPLIKCLQLPGQLVHPKANAATK
jgi:hypothetical protein